MFVQYADESPQGMVLVDWATNHKTMICLNGGNAAGIREMYDTLRELGTILELPFGKFHEDEQSLDGTMTCCAIVVPQPIYEFAARLRSDETILISENELSNEEMGLARLLNEFGLAK